MTHVNGYECESCGWVEFCDECFEWTKSSHRHEDPATYAK